MCALNRGVRVQGIHEVLRARARAGSVTYVLRHHIPRQGECVRVCVCVCVIAQRQMGTCDHHRGSGGEGRVMQPDSYGPLRNTSWHRWTQARPSLPALSPSPSSLLLPGSPCSFSPSILLPPSRCASPILSSLFLFFHRRSPAVLDVPATLGLVTSSAKPDELSSLAGLAATLPLLVPGYGVELAVKKTEYSAVDDTQVSGSSAPDPVRPDS